MVSGGQEFHSGISRSKKVICPRWACLSLFPEGDSIKACARTLIYTYYLEALEKWNASPFDLIFMDIEMPVMGGFEATLAIRKQEQQFGISQRTPIVGLSAYTSSEFVKQALDTGMDDYITKPYEKQKLFQAIAKCTETKTKKSYKTSNEVSPTTQHKKARIEI